jgi:teichuronic acid biosynthesis glycosyltransferase TuaG
MTNLPHPKVSVVTPAYNAENLISRTIQSVIDQTFTDWELIIVDDCSTDHTRKAVQAWTEQDARIRLVQVKKNFGGPAGPRNIGVENARGEYVAFLDADDIWHPQKLAIQIEVLDGGCCDFVCSQMSDFSSEESIRFPDFESYELETVSFAQQSIRARIPTSSVVVRQDLMKRYPFEESISYKAVEDYHCWLRMLESSPRCLKVRLPLLYYRKIEGQISGSKWYMMRKVFMVHRNYPGRSLFSAVFFTIGHVTVGLYHRYFKKGM